MAEKADHLIERAAALLRSANTAQIPDLSGGMGAPANFSPLPPAGPLAAPPNGVLGAAMPPPGAPPILTAPTRPTQLHGAKVALGQPPRISPAQPGMGQLQTAGLITSAANIPPSPSRPPISLETLERAGVMVARNNRTRIAEEYRIVIGRVLRALHDELPAEQRWESVATNVVMVTSARPGEGKSFTALNIAASIAQNAAESVLLVDVDAKSRSITDELGVGENRGFMDLIAQPELSPDDAVLPTELSNLAFLPLGNWVSRRGGGESDDELFDVRPITPAIHRLSQRYPKSLIILDAAPCLSTSDPHTLAPHVGQVVMVVEAERTQRADVEAALDLIRVCPNITMLLNKIRMTSNTTFGAYDYFGSYT